MVLKAIAFAMAMLVCGCASSTVQSGRQIDPAKVSQIQKGITTKTQIEAMFGPSTGTTLMGSGRHLVTYISYTDTSEAHVSAANFIPIAGGFVPVHGTGTARVQQLQIIYTSKDVVEDYSFSDNTTETTTAAGAFTGMSIQSQSAPTRAGQ